MVLKKTEIATPKGGRHEVVTTPHALCRGSTLIHSSYFATPIDIINALTDLFKKKR